MMEQERLDRRIAGIMAKIEALGEIEPEHVGDGWPPSWAPPFSEEETAAFEARHGIRLPEDYRRFLTTAASAGTQPFYGLNAPEQAADGCLKRGRPFLHTLDCPLVFLYMTEAEMDGWDQEVEGGFLDLCTEGDGMECVLIVDSLDPEVYGTVWFCDLANDFGIAPIRHPETGEPFRFLDWLEYWADRTAAEGAYNAFSFIELVRLSDPPEKPDILGRQMGLFD